MPFDGYFGSGERGHGESEELERRKLLALPKEARYAAYQRIKMGIYAGRQMSGGELLFYRDVKAKYNSAYHLKVGDERVRRIQEG
jgi:hypothetical protein